VIFVTPPAAFAGRVRVRECARATSNRNSLRIRYLIPYFFVPGSMMGLRACSATGSGGGTQHLGKNWSFDRMTRTDEERHVFRVT
jgi:hypothetical protein